MTELERYDGRPVDPTGGRLIAWAQAAAAAHQLAQALSKTSFVPKEFQGREYDATAAIIMGDELGLSPLAALRSIYVVHGQPSMYTRTMVALAQSHGHNIWTDESTETKVTVSGQRRGSSKVETSTWTIARAKKAGYTSNRKYDSNPQEMLYAKAAGEVARKIAADVLAGVGMSVEDLELEEPAPTTSIKRAAAARENTTSIKRADPSAPPVIPEPEFTPNPLDEFAPVELINAGQSAKMHALFNGMGITKDERAERLAITAQVIGHDITTSSELTKAEATQVIDHLENRATPLPDEPPLEGA
jgi:hypothetical protein